MKLAGAFIEHNIRRSRCYVFKESGRIDRRRRDEPFVSISAKSKVLVQSGLLDCHKEVAQREPDGGESASIASKNGGTSRDICRAYCHTLGLVANKCGVERGSATRGEKGKRRGDNVSPFWRPCWLGEEKKKRNRKSKRERERRIVLLYSYSGLR